jgi:hypothetical protein
MGISSLVSFEDIKEIHLNVINHQFKTIGPYQYIHSLILNGFHFHLKIIIWKLNINMIIDVWDFLF